MGVLLMGLLVIGGGTLAGEFAEAGDLGGAGACGAATLFILVLINDTVRKD
jgi:hypothetical protein